MIDRLESALLRAGPYLESARARVGACLGVIGVLLLIAALSLLGGCSAGPQLPVLTSPINISVTITAADGGSIEDSDVLIDRSSAANDAETTGNRARDVRVDPTVTTSVSAVP
jgi:hypothetical protein